MEVSTPDAVEHTSEIDDQTLEVRLKYPKEVRQQIYQIRKKYKDKYLEETVSFYGIRLCSQEALSTVKEICRQADRELKQIDKSLGVALTIVPITAEIKLKGKLYEAVYYAILTDAHKRILKRIDHLKKEEMQDRTKESLRELIAHLRRLNVLNDQEIDSRISQMEQLVDKRVSEIRSTIKNDLDLLLEKIRGL